jgi:hypothetical protein
MAPTSIRATVQFATPKRRTLTQPQETRAKHERKLCGKAYTESDTEDEDENANVIVPCFVPLDNVSGLFSEAAQLSAEPFSAASVAGPAVETASATQSPQR